MHAGSNGFGRRALRVGAVITLLGAGLLLMVVRGSAQIPSVDALAKPITTTLGETTGVKLPSTGSGDTLTVTSPGTLELPGGTTVTVGSGGGSSTTAGGGSTGSTDASPLPAGSTYTVAPGGGAVSLPAGSSVTLPPGGGAVVALRAPGFTPASASFISLGGAAPPIGAPKLLVPFPIVLIEGTYTPRGVHVRRLRITAAGAMIQLRCRGRRCPRGLRVQRGQAARTLRFGRFQRRYRAGSVLEVRVTRPGKIGKHTRFDVKRSKPPTRLDRCIVGNARLPTACPR